MPQKSRSCFRQQYSSHVFLEGINCINLRAEDSADPCDVLRCQEFFLSKSYMLHIANIIKTLAQPSSPLLSPPPSPPPHSHPHYDSQHQATTFTAIHWYFH